MNHVRVLMAKRNQSVFVYTTGLLLCSLLIAALTLARPARTQTCPNLAPGDLFKVPNNTAVYLLNQDMRRMYFPHQSVYFTWFDNFNAVKTIPNECVDQYPAPSNKPFGVNYRPGSYLVKTNVSPTVYVVEPGGNLRRLDNETVAAQLYEADWLSDIIDVPDVFWANYEQTTGVVTQAIPHNGMLVRTSAGGEVYFVAEGQRHRVVGGLGANTAASIQTISTAVMNTVPLSNKTVTEAIIRARPALGTHGTINGAGQGVFAPSVRLSAQSPGATVLPQNVDHVPYMVVDIIGGDESTTLTGITFERIGAGSRGKFTGLWLEQDGIPVSFSRLIGSNERVTFAPDIPIPAATNVRLTLKGSVENAAVLEQDAFRIAAAGDISFANNARADGSFPVTGATMTYNAYQVGTLAIDAAGANETVSVGSAQSTVGSFRIAYSTPSGRNGDLQSVLVRLRGSASIGDLNNIVLTEAGQVVSKETIVRDNEVLFRFKDDYRELRNGDVRVFEIRAGIVSGSDGETFIFELSDDRNVHGIEMTTLFGLDVNNNVNGSAAGRLFTYTIDAGQLSISRDGSTPSEVSRAPGAQDTLVLAARVNAGQTIEAEGLRVWLHDSSVLETSALEDRTQINNDLVRVELWVNNTLIETVNTVRTAGSANNNNAVETGEFFYQFNNSFRINDGDIIKLVVDLSAQARHNEYAFMFAATDFSAPRYLVNNTLVPSSKLSGSATSGKLIIREAGFLVTRTDGMADGEALIAGSQDAELMRFLIQAGNESALRVRTLQFTTNQSSTYLQNNHHRINDCKLTTANGQTQLGGSVTMSSAGAITFSGFNYAIERQGQAEFRLTCDIAANIETTNNLQFILTQSGSVIETEAGNRITNWNNVGSAQFVIAEAGDLQVAVDPAAAGERLLALGATGTQTAVPVGSWRLSARDDAALVSQLYVANNSQLGGNTPEADADNLVQRYQLVVNGQVLQERTPQNGKVSFDLSGNNRITVPRNGVVTVHVRALFNGIVTPAQTGKSIALSLYGLRATSASSGQLIPAGSISGVDQTTDNTSTLDNALRNASVTLYKTVPTVTFSTLDSTVLVNGTRDLYAFSVAADAAGSVSWGQVSLDISGTCAAGAAIDCLSNFRVYEVKNTGARVLLPSAASATGGQAGSNEVRLRLNVAETVAAGTEKFYVVEAALLGFTGNDGMSVRIFDYTNTHAAPSTLADAIAAGGFLSPLIWSDNSGVLASPTVAHWHNGHLVPGIPTRTITFVR